MGIDVTTARRVAHLARIAVNEDELAHLTQEFEAILGFVDQLGEVDIENVAPMTSVHPMPLRRRQDIVTEGGDPAMVLANAPDAREGFFAVPKVIE